MRLRFGWGGQSLTRSMQSPGHRGILSLAVLAFVMVFHGVIAAVPGASPDGAEVGGAVTNPGESFLLRRWSTQHGLPQNTVTCLEQTPDGYLWLGTRYGLVRYDGVQFTTFLAELGDASSDSVDCRSLASDSEGTLWALTRGGLFAYRHGRFERHSPGLADNKPFGLESIAPGRSGGLWLGGRGRVAWFHGDRIEAGYDSTRGFRSDWIAALWEDRAGRLWLQFDFDGRRTWQRFDPTTGEVRHLSEVVGGGWPRGDQLRPNHWDMVHEDRQGRLWACSQDTLACVDQGVVTRYPAQGLPVDRNVRGLREDLDGDLWIFTEGAAQLHRFDGKRFTQMTRFGPQTLDPDVRAVLADREGNIWIGSGSAGLYRIQRRQLLSKLRATESSMDEVLSVHATPEQGAWLGTPHGLLHVTPEGTQRMHEENGKSGPRVKPAFQDRSGKVWMGIQGAGLSVLDGNIIKATGILAPDNSSGWHVRALFQDHAGTLWVGTSCGLLRITNTETNWLTDPAGLGTNAVQGIVQTPDHALWFGTEGSGVRILESGRWRNLRKADGLLNDRVWPLAVEPDGAVWLGTAVGLNRVRGHEVRSVTVSEGLHDNLAYSLIDDGKGWYWCHCNRGLWRMRKKELNAVADGVEPHVFCVSYDETDGMDSAEGNGDEQPSAARLANGELWFPTTRGVAIVDPARLRDNAVRPLTVIEAVTADGRELVGSKNPMPPRHKQEGPPPLLTIPPGQARVLEVHYTAPSFSDPERLRFRYMLEGHDQGWQDAGSRRVAYYTALAPGHYTFRVAAGNHHGYWTEAPATLELELKPRFQQTTTFRILVIVVVGISLATLHLARVRYVHQINRLRHREALEAERTRIGRDLHDDLGAGLAGIALQTELAQNLAKSGQPADHLLTRVTGSARSLSGLLREVVWALNPACDTLENFVSFITGFAEDFLGQTSVRCRIEVPSSLPQIPLPAETRHGLVLAVKEAITNAVRHGHPTQLDLVIRWAEEELRVEVRDDGCGFDVAAVTRQQPAGGGALGGSGLPNLRRRLAGLGGRCSIVSEPGAGTKVTLTLPMRPSHEPRRAWRGELP